MLWCEDVLERVGQIQSYMYDLADFSSLPAIVDSVDVAHALVSARNVFWAGCDGVPMLQSARISVPLKIYLVLGVKMLLSSSPIRIFDIALLYIRYMMADTDIQT